MLEPVNRARRAYNAPRRRQQAAATRARILAAARQLLCTRGYPATSLTMVAEAAQVSVESVYAYFGTKRGLLLALVETSVDAPEFDQQVQAAFITAEPRQLFAMTARFARAAYDRSWDVVEIMRGAGVSNPDIAETWRQADARARVSQSAVIELLYGRNALRTDVTRAEAADILWSLTVPDLYRLLVIESGWTSDRYEQFLSDALARLLLKSTR